MTASSTSAVMRCGVDTERSTPQFSLNSHSFFGWFTRAIDAGHAELLLGEQRDDEVVLVVAGRGDDDVAALEPGCAQRGDLARVGDVPLDAVGSVCDALDDGRVLLDEQHLVAGGARGRWR